MGGIVDVSCDDWIQSITEKWKTHADSQTDFIVFFGKVCQKHSLDREQGLPADSECCSHDIDDPLVSRDHELKGQPAKQNGNEAQNYEEKQRSSQRVSVNEDSDWDLKKYYWQKLKEI